MNALEISHLKKTFSGRAAVNDLTLAVRPGEIFALLGVNGAGKTTTLRALCGLIPFDSGEIRIFGHAAGTSQAKSLLGLSPQETAVAEIRIHLLQLLQDNDRRRLL